MARGIEGAKEALRWYKPIAIRHLKRDVITIAICAAAMFVAAVVAAALGWID